MGRLEAQHSELVKSKWGVTQPCTLGIQQSIEKLNSTAVFSDDDPSLPVSWKLEYPNKEIGYAYTMENHRGKGLGHVTMEAMCRQHFEDCHAIPPYMTVQKSYLKFEVFGFVKSGYLACCY